MARFVILILVLLPAGVHAQEYRIEAWTADDGLPQNSVSRVLQTRDGFIWLSTFSGLARYDGARFEVFNVGTVPGLTASRFTNLFEDAEGTLWASTEGQGVVRYRDGTFQMVAGAAFGLADPSALAFSTAVDGRLLLDTAVGVVTWNGQRFVPYDKPFPSAAEPGTRVLSTAPGGVVWSLRQGTLRRVPIAEDVRWLFEDSQGRLWMETSTRSLRALVRWDNGVIVRFGAADGVPAFSTMAVKETADGTIWFGLRGDGGLLRYRAGRFTRLTTADGLPSNNVGSVVQDREGSIWVPTEGGLARISPRSVSTFGQADGLSTDNVYAILEDTDGSVLVGGWRGDSATVSFHRVDLASGTTTTTALSLVDTNFHPGFALVLPLSSGSQVFTAVSQYPDPLKARFAHVDTTNNAVTQLPVEFGYFYWAAGTAVDIAWFTSVDGLMKVNMLTGEATLIESSYYGPVAVGRLQ